HRRALRLFPTRRSSDLQTLFIGGLARFDFLSGDRSSFTIHVSNEIPIHRTKLENADALYAAHLGEMLSPPSGDSLEKMPPLVRQDRKSTRLNSSHVKSR